MQPLPVGKGCPGMQRLADLAFAVPKERRNQAHDAATGDRSDPDSGVSGIVPKPWLASAAKLWKFISAVVALASSGLVTFVWSKTIDSSGQKTIHTLPSSSEESQCTFTSVQNRSRAPDRGHQRQRKHPKMAMVRTEALRARGFPDCQKRSNRGDNREVSGILANTCEGIKSTRA